MLQPTMRVDEAWRVLSGWVENLEGLAEIVDAFRDGEELGDSELNVRMTESGGVERITEATAIVYQVLADNGWVPDPDESESYDLSY